MERFGLQLAVSYGIVLEICSVFIWYMSGCNSGGMSSEVHNGGTVSCQLNRRPRWAEGTAKFLRTAKIVPGLHTMVLNFPRYIYL